MNHLQLYRDCFVHLHNILDGRSHLSNTSLASAGVNKTQLYCLLKSQVGGAQACILYSSTLNTLVLTEAWHSM